MRFKFVFSAEWPSLPQCLALCLNIIIQFFNSIPHTTSNKPLSTHITCIPTRLSFINLHSSSNSPASLFFTLSYASFNLSWYSCFFSGFFQLFHLHYFSPTSYHSISPLFRYYHFCFNQKIIFHTSSHTPKHMHIF